jgi:hypothetical protein
LLTTDKYKNQYEKKYKEMQDVCIKLKNISILCYALEKKGQQDKYLLEHIMCNLADQKFSIILPESDIELQLIAPDLKTVCIE